MEGEYILELKNITKRFPGVIALKNVSIALKRGEVLAICGENGAGKTTLMKVLSGSYTSKEYDGEIWIDGEKADFTSVAIAEACGIEMVYQELNVLLDASLAENIYVGNLPLKGAFVDFNKLYKDTSDMLNQVGLDLNPKQRVRGLNSGQMQMISIARALSKSPRIIVLDEPTSSLTDKETDILMETIHRLRAKGVSFLFISHKLDEVFRIADRVVVMRDGAVITTNEISQVTTDELVTAMIGRPIENMYPEHHSAKEKEVLRVEHLTVPHPSNKGQNIVEDISFSLYEGEILGIGGLMGAGRSEVLSAIFGYISKGVKKEIYINGKKVNIRTPLDAIRNGMGYVTEERKQTGFIWVQSIRENLTLACLKKVSPFWFVLRKKEKEIAQRMSDRLEVKAPSIETMMVNLSGGNQQKVVVGKWLLMEPKILLIDEPTKGIDVSTKAELYKIMSELTGKGYSIILVSSDMPELVSMSDRCLVLSNKHITGEFAGSEITQKNVMKAAIA